MWSASGFKQMLLYFFQYFRKLAYVKGYITGVYIPLPDLHSRKLGAVIIQQLNLTTRIPAIWLSAVTYDATLQQVCAP